MSILTKGIFEGIDKTVWIMPMRRRTLCHPDRTTPPPARSLCCNYGCSQLRRMKLLSWNIQHGGGTRDVRIVSAIADHNPDIIALTEFRSRPGMALRQAFAANGWPHIASSSPTGIDNGICVLSRTPLRCDRPSTAPPENAVRWLDVDLPEQGFGFTVIHILTANPGAKEPEGAAKTRYWEALLAAAQARIAEPLLFLGDFNTGIPLVEI